MLKKSLQLLIFLFASLYFYFKLLRNIFQNLYPLHFLPLVRLHIFIPFVWRNLCYGTLSDSHRLERGNPCSDILFCRDRSIKIVTNVKFQKQFSPPANRSVRMAWDCGTNPASCLMPRWLQAEVWDVLTGWELTDKPETVVRNNGAGAASSGNMHKYVHRDGTAR